MESVNRVTNTQAYAVMKIGCLKIKPLARSGLGEGWWPGTGLSSTQHYFN
jgi:hypothetical protein